MLHDYRNGIFATRRLHITEKGHRLITAVLYVWGWPLKMSSSKDYLQVHVLVEFVWGTKSLYSGALNGNYKRHCLLWKSYISLVTTCEHWYTLWILCSGNRIWPMVFYTSLPESSNGMYEFYFLYGPHLLMKISHTCNFHAFFVVYWTLYLGLYAH